MVNERSEEWMIGDGVKWEKKDKKICQSTQVCLRLQLKTH